MSTNQRQIDGRTWLELIRISFNIFPQRYVAYPADYSGKQLEEMIPTLSMVVVKTLDNDMFNSTNCDYITNIKYLPFVKAFSLPSLGLGCFIFHLVNGNDS